MSAMGDRSYGHMTYARRLYVALYDTISALTQIAKTASMKIGHNEWAKYLFEVFLEVSCVFVQNIILTKRLVIKSVRYRP
jgi:hypothetical protein